MFERTPENPTNLDLLDAVDALHDVRSVIHGFAMLLTTCDDLMPCVEIETFAIAVLERCAAVIDEALPPIERAVKEARALRAASPAEAD